MTEFSQRKHDLPGGQTNIKSWYGENYPTDELKDGLNPGATFQQLYECLQVGFDVYAFLGVSDSLVRERCFDALATMMGCSYDVIYYQWLGHDRMPSPRVIYENMHGLRFHNE